MDSFFFPSNSIRGSLSFDRLTFLLYKPSLSLWGDNDNWKKVDAMSHLIEKLCSSSFDPDFPQGCSSELFKRHYRTVNGVDIQFGPFMPKRKKISDETFLEAFGSQEEKEQGFAFRYSPNDYSFRVEYNPNKTDLSEIKILLENFSRFGFTSSLLRIARLDIAIDYPVELNPALCFCDRIRKSFLAIGSSGIETVYFGSRASQFYIRLYNKALEQREVFQKEISTPLWRFELESKKSFTFDCIPDFGKILRRFSFYSGGIKSGDWKMDLLLAYAREYGIKAALSFLPETTSKRYKKIFDEFDRFNSLETPFECFERSFPSAFQKLRHDLLSSLGCKFLEVEKNGF